MRSRAKLERGVDSGMGSARTPMRESDLSAFYDCVFLPLVRRATWRYGLSKEDARDVVQDAFVIAIEKIDSAGNPRAWLTQVVDHLALNYLRKAQRRARLVAQWERPIGEVEPSIRDPRALEGWGHE